MIEEFAEGIHSTTDVFVPPIRVLLCNPKQKLADLFQPIFACPCGNLCIKRVSGV
jgi:hypothetical protein